MDDNSEPAWPSTTAADANPEAIPCRNTIAQFSFSASDAAMLAQAEINPLEMADDFCDYSKVVVKKPWGYEYLIFQNAAVAVWILYLKADAETSMHSHPNKKTSLVVLEGRVECSTLNNCVERTPSEGLLIDKGVFHQTKAISRTGAFVMEIETPINKRDLVRLTDKYGREGKGYEGAEMHSTNVQNYNYLSLNNREVCSNLKKHFGQCTLTFRKLEPFPGIAEILGLKDEDVISVLRGRILQKDSSTGLGEGDTISVGDLRRWDRLEAPVDLEVIIIKKVDRMVKVSNCVAGLLQAQGVRDVFLVPGDANVHLLDSIGRHEGLSFICNQMEKSSSMAAEGYSKTCGELGVLVISCGGSGPNALPGVANAWIDSTPLLVISGQARTDQDSNGQVRQLGNKSFNIVDVVKPITKYAVKVSDPAMIRYHLEKAIYLARNGRPGPVWVDIPIDIQGMTLDENELKGFTGEDVQENLGATNDQISEILELLTTARQPVLLGGNGIRISGAQDEFLELIKRLGIPVLTSRRGADLVAEEHPLFFGRPGVYGQRRANLVLQNADLLISVGSRLSIPLIGRNTKAFARAAKKVVVDIDRDELEKETIQPDIAIQGDAGEFISGLVGALSCFRGNYSAWIEKCRAWSRNFSPLAEGYRHSGLVNPYLFVRELSEKLRDNDVIVVDGGSIMNYVMQTFKVRSGQRLISSTGLELPGFALAGAIGACVSGGRREVVCLCEDRGLHICMQELQTIAARRLPIKIFNLKSRGNSTIRKIQKDFFGSRYVGTDEEILGEGAELIEVARVYGLPTRELGHPDSIGLEIQAVLEQPGPVVCGINVDIDQELIPRMGFTVRDDGKWLAKPLEDMYPFLDREVLQTTMTIDLWKED